MDLFGLFLSTLLAATLLPGGSEVALVYIDSVSEHGFWVLLVVAAAGNTIGGMVSYLMGRIIPQRNSSKPEVQKAVSKIKMHGSPILLLSWVPFIGDVLCVAAGWLRVNWIAAVIFIGIGKTVRYAAVLLVF